MIGQKKNKSSQKPDQYAKGIGTIDETTQVGDTATDTAGKEVLELADVAASATVEFDVASGKVTTLTYTNAASKTCTYTATTGEYKVNP